MSTIPKKSRVVLLIEDDAFLASLLGRFLEKYGFHVVHADRAEIGLREVDRARPEAVLLDISLPGMSGLDACREIRQRSTVPIILISGLGETSDKIVGLQLGADDYLPKPFEPRELVARLEALLRRAEGRWPAGAAEGVVTVGTLEVDRGRRCASLDGSPIELSASELELLLVLVGKPGHVFSRDDLLNAVRGIDWDSYNRSVDVVVSRLRRKLKDDPRQPKFLKTVWGAGYVFLPPAEKREAS